MIARNHVGLVVDRNFGERVRTLAPDTPVWLIESSANRTAAEAIWAALTCGEPVDAPRQEITVFKSPPPLSPDEAVAEILDTVVEHHPRMTVLEIYGAQDPHIWARVLAEMHFVVAETEVDRVVCTKEP